MLRAHSTRPRARGPCRLPPYPRPGQLHTHIWHAYATHPPLHAPCSSHAVQARVALLFASGLFAAYDLDLSGELWATHTTASAAAARVGRVTDVGWLPLPGTVGETRGDRRVRWAGGSCADGGLAPAGVLLSKRQKRWGLIYPADGRQWRA